MPRRPYAAIDISFRFSRYFLIIIYFTDFIRFLLDV